MTIRGTASSPAFDAPKMGGICWSVRNDICTLHPFLKTYVKYDDDKEIDVGDVVKLVK